MTAVNNHTGWGELHPFFVPTVVNWQATEFDHKKSSFFFLRNLPLLIFNKRLLVLLAT